LTAISLLIAEDDELVADVLLELLAGDASIEVVGLARDAEETIALAREHLPDVALVDVRMPLGGGARAARALALLSPPPRVIAYSAFDDREGVIAMLQAGAVAYVVKGGPIDDVSEAVGRAARGQFTLSPAAADHVVGALVEHLEREEGASAAQRAAAARIDAALAPGAIELVFQAIFGLSDREIVGHEALARFVPPPRRGPDEWFAEALEIGRSIELELAALRAASAAVRVAGDGIAAGAFVSLNASPATILSDGFVDALACVPSDRLVVEVTEHAPISDYVAFARALAGLRARGARLAVDDVGAGYASLRHIVDLGADIIKIDLSLTRGIDADPSRRAVTAALVSFAAETGASVVAEGIETEAELETMRELGVGYGQGYLLARPVALT
jgi:EAL domain-containing protein (putative c-di-GMP-specific phosphodiesterase class I)/response regulator of citrate/malate metabolism